MSDIKISDMTDAGTIAETDMVPVVRAGANSRAVVGTAATEDSDAFLLAANNLSDLPSASDARTNLSLVPGTHVQTQDADLQAFADLDATVGLLAKTGAGTYARRTITGGGGVTVTNGDGSGNPTLSVANLRTIWIPAVAIRPAVTGGCASVAAIASAANQPDIVSLDFSDTVEEYAWFSVRFPKAWNEGTITAQFHWSHPSTTTNFAVIWGIAGIALSNDDAIATALGTAVTVTDTGGTTNDLYISDATAAVTIAGSPAAGDQVFFRVYRDADAGGDTLAVDARLMGVTLYYTVDTLDDT